MKLSKAIKKGYLRVVPTQDNGRYPVPYKNEKVIDYKTLINQKVCLVNVQGKFIFAKKDDDLSKVTLTTHTGRSLIYIDDEQLSKDSKYGKTSKSDFVVFELTNAVLSAEIINLSYVREEVVPDSFAKLCLRVIKGEKITDKNLASLLCDYRTKNIFETDDLVKLTSNGELIEIAKQVTPRAKLLIQEVKDGVDKPVSLELFETKVLKNVSKLD